MVHGSRGIRFFQPQTLRVTAYNCFCSRAAGDIGAVVFCLFVFFRFFFNGHNGDTEAFLLSPRDRTAPRAECL